MSEKPKMTGATYDRIKLIQGQAKMLDRTIRAILPFHKHRTFALDHLRQATDWAVQLVTDLDKDNKDD